MKLMKHGQMLVFRQSFLVKKKQKNVLKYLKMS